MDTKNNDEKLEQEVIRALRARGLREQMDVWEEERRKQEQPPQKIVRLGGFSKRVLVPMGVAAMLCGLLWTVVPTSTWRHGYRVVQREYAKHFGSKHTSAPQNTDEVLLTLAAPAVAEIGERATSRQALGCNDLLAEAVAEMQLGHYRIAQGLLEDCSEALDETDPHYAQTADDIDCLSAICELGRGHRARAKRQLEVIARSDSRHAQQAADWLKHFK